MKIQDLSLLEAFAGVAKESSFTKAAERLRIGTPRLSKKIARLEETLSVRLFQRSTRRVSLTAEGRSLLPHVESLLEDFKSLEARFEDESRLSGTIRLTCLTSIAHRLLAPLIVEFSRLHPEVKFEVDTSDHLVDLIESQMDLGIRIQAPTGSDHVYKRLAPNKLVFCASPDYLERTRAPLRRAEDLHKHRVIMFRAYENCRLKSKGKELRLGDFADAQMIQANSGLFLTELALSGAGIAVRSLWDVHSLLETGRLVQVLKHQPIENFGDIYAVIPSRRLLAPRVRAFIDFLVEGTRTWN